MFQIGYVSKTASTNDDAARLLGEPGSAGLVLVAEMQHAGKGRRERRWIAPPGSALLFTAILPRSLRADALWAVPFWTGLAVAEAIETYAGIRVGLQWPNDLLLDGRKCGGILCISRVAGESAWVGCGVGLNVVRPAGATELDALDPPPSFLSDRRPQSVERDQLLQAILSAFTRRLGELDDPATIAARWQTRAELAGTPYRILLDDGSAPFEASALRLSPDGGLVVTRDGIEQTISLAEARVLRD